MRENARPVLTRFGPDTRFELRPTPPFPFRTIQENALERLKNRLLRDTLFELPDARLNADVRRAANEAAAVAWETRYPLLVFPALFEEKTRNVLRHAERQVSIRRRSLELLTV
ncbi:MAG TPA: hypothetical protein VEH04_19500 [Verrucomicrobiae bacterium]|nr:hypothetical protein [Verrucomicrobiae bacterium]